jgi:hypothetical protein
MISEGVLGPISIMCFTNACAMLGKRADQTLNKSL